MSLAREWAVFAGALFSLMGVSLAADAPRRVTDMLSWVRQWQEASGQPGPQADAPDRRTLERAYRAVGALFAVAGLVVLAAVLSGRASLAARERGPGDLAAGLFFAACAVVLAFNAWRRAGRRAPRFLEGELTGQDSPPPLGERLAQACSHGMIALFLVFGVRLLGGALR